MAKLVPLIGRDQDLALVETFLHDWEDGSAALTREGPAGIGKTALWETALARARERGVTVLLSRSSGDEQHFGFAGLADLLSGLDAEVLSALPPAQGQALSSALLLRDPHGAISTRAVASATLGVIRDLAASRRVVIAVDDVPWLDAASAGALAFAGRRLDREPVRLLFTRRTPSRGTSALEQATRAAAVQLDSLSFGAIGQLLQARLGVRLGRRAARRLYDTAAGNPLFALELARVASRRGTLDALGEGAPLPGAIENVLRERLDDLAEGQLDALLAAELGAGARAVDLAAIAGEGAVERALEAGLLERDAERLRPSHPLLGAAAVSRAGPARRREVHRQLATVEPDRERRAARAASPTGPSPSTAAVRRAPIRRPTARPCRTAGARRSVAS